MSVLNVPSGHGEHVRRWCAAAAAATNCPAVHTGCGAHDGWLRASVKVPFGQRGQTRSLEGVAASSSYVPSWQSRCGRHVCSLLEAVK